MSKKNSSHHIVPEVAHLINSDAAQTMVSSFYSATEILTHCSAAAANIATRPPARTHKNIISLLAQCSLLLAACGGGQTQKISGQIFLLPGPGSSLHNICCISLARLLAAGCCWLPGGVAGFKI